MIILSSLTVGNTPLFPTRSVQLIFSIFLQDHISKTVRVFLFYPPKCQSFSTINSYAPNLAVQQFKIKNTVYKIWVIIFQSSVMTEYYQVKRKIR